MIARDVSPFGDRVDAGANDEPLRKLLGPLGIPRFRIETQKESGVGRDKHFFTGNDGCTKRLADLDPPSNLAILTVAPLDFVGS